MITQEPSMSAARTIRESQEYFLALRRAAHRTLFFRDPVPAPRPSEERLNEDLQRREEIPSGQLPSGSGSLHESSAVSIKTKKNLAGRPPHMNVAFAGKTLRKWPTPRKKPISHSPRPQVPGRKEESWVVGHCMSHFSHREDDKRKEQNLRPAGKYGTLGNKIRDPWRSSRCLVEPCGLAVEWRPGLLFYRTVVHAYGSAGSPPP